MLLYQKKRKRMFRKKVLRKCENLMTLLCFISVKLEKSFQKESFNIENLRILVLNKKIGKKSFQKRKNFILR